MFSHSPGSTDSKNIKMSPELQWEVPPQEWSFSGQIMLKIQGEMAIIFYSILCGLIKHNFSPKKYFIKNAYPQEVAKKKISCSGARRMGKHTELKSNLSFDIVALPLINIHPPYINSYFLSKLGVGGFGGGG